jgi:hypothetical protein
LKRLSFRILLPTVAAVFFVMLCFAATRQSHVIDLEGWGHSSENTIAWGAEPVDIGTPADVLLLAFNLPALIALLPLLPLAYWVESEIVLRIAWGLAAVGQWFLIGRYFDSRKRLSNGERSLSLPFKKILFSITLVAGVLAFGLGAYSVAAGHSSPWAIGMAASSVFWGLVLVIFALRWRLSSADHIDSLRIS